MLRSSHDPIRLRSVVRVPVAWTFFKPVQLHRQLPDLLVELRHQPLRVLVLTRRRLEQFRQAIPNHTFPLRDLHRVNLVLSSNLPDRFHTDHRFHCDLRLEGPAVSSAFV